MGYAIERKKKLSMYFGVTIRKTAGIITKIGNILLSIKLKDSEMLKKVR